MAQRSFAKVLGPGLLFAGAAVGVSHLVQSTRAGAGFGLSLLLVILLANVMKYPAFSFGPRYAAATGNSLLEGYRRQGTWALVIYGVLTLLTMFTVQAAVTVVTAGLANSMVGSTVAPVWTSLVLTAMCAGILIAGHYRWLDRIIKVAVALLTVSTLLATAMVLPRVEWNLGQTLLPDDPRALFFIAALVGWMPSAIDVSVWHSLWTVAKRTDTGYQPTVRESLLDFNIGYVGTAFLAFCFVLLGAGVVYGTGAALPASAGGFAAALVKLYTSTLGDWSLRIIGPCALLVMFSTTLTVVDGFPRALGALFGKRVVYWISMAVLAVGSLAIIQFYLGDLKSLVDLATTLSFLTAPILAILNHRAVLADEVPPTDRPGTKMVVFSLVGIAFLGAFALYYLYLRFLS